MMIIKARDTATGGAAIKASDGLRSHRQAAAAGRTMTAAAAPVHAGARPSTGRCQIANKTQAQRTQPPARNFGCRHPSVLQIERRSQGTGKVVAQPLSLNSRNILKGRCANASKAKQRDRDQ